MAMSTSLNETQLLALIENSPDAVSLLDEKLFPIYRNPAAYRMTGYTLEERRKDNGMDQAHPEDLEKLKQAFKDAIANPAQPLFVSFRTLHKKGHYIFLEGTFTNYLNDKNLKAIVCNVRDVTEHKMAERALQNTETIFKNLVEHSFVGVYVHSEGKFVYVNPRLAEIFGYTPAELIGQPVEVLAYPDDAPIVLENIRLRLERKLDRTHYEVRGTKKDGEIVEVEIFGNFTYYQDKPAIIGSLIDITQRKQTENALLKQTYDIAERVKELNALYGTSEIVNRSGKSIDDILQECVNIIPPSYQYPEITSARIIFNNKKFESNGFKESIWTQEAELINSETSVGKIEVFYSEKRPQEQEGPFLKEERFLINSLADIISTATERKKTEEYLTQSEKRLQHFVETNIAGVGIIITNAMGDISLTNDYYLNMIGYTRKEFDQGKVNWREITPPEWLYTDERAIAELRERGTITPYEKEYVKRDGSRVPVFITNTSLPGQREEVVTFFLDLTESKKAEKQIREAAEIQQLIMESSLDAIIGMDTNGEIIIWTQQAEKIFGWKEREIMGKKLKDTIIPKQYRERHSEGMKHYLKTGAGPILRRPIEITALNQREEEFPVEMSITPVKQGDKKFFIAYIKDITERKKAEHVLKIHQSNLKSIIENTDASIYSLDTDFCYITFNQFLYNTMKELYGMEIKPGDKVFDFLEKLDLEEAKWWKGIYSKALKGEKLQFVKEFRINDNHSFSSFSINPIWENKNVIGLSCFARDITKEKFSEEKLIRSEIQIRNFAQHLNHIQEEERAHLAREIHDELGQQLIGIKIGISSFAKRPEGNIRGTEMVKNMVKDVDNTIQSLRKIATELRPGILDSLGLIPSIKWLATEFQEKTKIKCKTELKVREQKFEKNISICFFRICQEALTNITKHSHATEVSIQMNFSKNKLSMTITDNGKGIAGEKLENPFSMGLLGMRERANVIGGDIKITSKKGKGTSIQLLIHIN